MATAAVGVPFRLLPVCGYSDAALTEVTAHPVAAVYPHSTVNGTLTCISHSGTLHTLYETHVASQKESG